MSFIILNQSLILKGNVALKMLCFYDAKAKGMVKTPAESALHPIFWVLNKGVKISGRAKATHSF